MPNFFLQDTPHSRFAPLSPRVARNADATHHLPTALEPTHHLYPRASEPTTTASTFASPAQPRTRPPPSVRTHQLDLNNPPDRVPNLDRPLIRVHPHQINVLGRLGRDDPADVRPSRVRDRRDAPARRPTPHRRTVTGPPAADAAQEIPPSRLGLVVRRPASARRPARPAPGVPPVPRPVPQRIPSLPTNNHRSSSRRHCERQLSRAEPVPSVALGGQRGRRDPHGERHGGSREPDDCVGGRWGWVGAECDRGGRTGRWAQQERHGRVAGHGVVGRGGPVSVRMGGSDSLRRDGVQAVDKVTTLQNVRVESEMGDALYFARCAQMLRDAVDGSRGDV